MSTDDRVSLDCAEAAAICQSILWRVLARCQEIIDDDDGGGTCLRLVD